MVFIALIACHEDPSLAKPPIDFGWNMKNECRETSPEIRITGLPQRAGWLRVRSIGLHLPSLATVKVEFAPLLEMLRLMKKVDRDRKADAEAGLTR